MWNAFNLKPNGNLPWIAGADSQWKGTKILISVVVTSQLALNEQGSEHMGLVYTWADLCENFRAVCWEL